MSSRLSLPSLVALTAVLALTAAGCSQENAGTTTSTPTPSATSKPTDLTLAVYGSEGETAAFRSLTDDFMDERADVKVGLEVHPDHESAARALRSATTLPDVFMVSRSDLPWLVENDLIQPVDQLLDERGVSFSETYARDSTQAFANDNGLMCLPYEVSPMVVYINTELIDRERMAARGLVVPADGGRWSWEQFEAAARFAARPKRGTWGVYIEPTLRQLAPFVYAAGGEIFDDQTNPTSTVFGSDDTQAALERILPVLRDSRLTPSESDLDNRTAMDLFEQGKVGMIVGTRALVPPLRETSSLEFDVMPIPSIARTQTTAEISGVCMSADTVDRDRAADVIMAAFSTAGINRIAREGYLVPANVPVAQSASFLQPERQPTNATVYTAAMRHIVLPPMIDNFEELARVLDPDIRELLTVPLLELPDLAATIDEDSRQVLSPETETETSSPTASPEASETP